MLVSKFTPQTLLAQMPDTRLLIIYARQTAKKKTEQPPIQTVGMNTNRSRHKCTITSNCNEQKQQQMYEKKKIAGESKRPLIGEQAALQNWRNHIMQPNNTYNIRLLYTYIELTFVETQNRCLSPYCRQMHTMFALACCGCSHIVETHKHPTCCRSLSLSLSR